MKLSVVYNALIVLAFSISPSICFTEYHDYIVVGGGPAGLQIGYFLDRSNRDYIILERDRVAGSFFTIYPRHDQLISINKRHTGKTNVEFNLRHDWNSLITETADRRSQPTDERRQRDEDEAAEGGDKRMSRFGAYSRQMFPDRMDMVRYLNDFAANASLRIRYETDVNNISRLTPDHSSDEAKTASGESMLKFKPRFSMKDQHGNEYNCHTLIVSTGLWKPNEPNMEGSEFIEGYESVSTNPEDFEGLNVLILGRGNSAFELARRIYGSTNLIHMVGRSRVRLSWATHYVGDLRAINNELLDTYQLKSLDGIFEAPVEMMAIRRRNGKLYLEVRDDVNLPYSQKTKDSADKPQVNDEKASSGNESDSSVSYGRFTYHDNFAVREPYDKVIRCLGFKFNDSIFSEDMLLSRPKGRRAKYPKINHGYESVDFPGLYFAGTATHSLDWRKSAGGFIHGFRYTARALHRLLEWKNHAVPWPVRSGSIIDLLPAIVKRINEASGIYQMYRMLGDVIVLRGTTFEYIEEFPFNLLHELPKRTGLRMTSVEDSNVDNKPSSHSAPVTGILVLSLEYGHKFSGPNHDVFRLDRATGEPSLAHHSNFLHPVFYYYKVLPTAQRMNQRGPMDILPRPDRLHHVVEDFLTTWDGPDSHILPLRRFIESLIGPDGKDLRSFFADTCMVISLTHQSVPLSCTELYLNGAGLDRPSTLASLVGGGHLSNSSLSAVEDKVIDAVLPSPSAFNMRVTQTKIGGLV